MFRDPIENRARALRAYHQVGAARRRGRTLEKHFRKAIRRADSLRNTRLSGLVATAKRVLHSARTPEHRRILRALRRRFEKALNGSRSTAFVVGLTGGSLAHLQCHLEKQFTDGMSWDNYGPSGWHIDHVKPCASFDLRDPEQLRKCFHYTNLQPLWAKDNLKKGARVPQSVRQNGTVGTGECLHTCPVLSEKLCRIPDNLTTVLTCGTVDREDEKSMKQ